MKSAKRNGPPANQIDVEGLHLSITQTRPPCLSYLIACGGELCDEVIGQLATHHAIEPQGSRVFWAIRTGLGTQQIVWIAICVEQYSEPTLSRRWSAFDDRLVGLVVKASTSRAEGPGLESRLRRDFFGAESYQ